MGNVIRFGQFVIDLDRRLLTRSGEPLAVQPKVLQLLVLLIEHHPAAVPKRKIYETLWPDVIVEEANVHNLIADLRILLDDDTRSMIRTVHRYGYAFAGELERSSQWELRIGDRRITLMPGENIVGRDDDVDARVDEPSVSRRHARIVLTEGVPFIEDLGSKNGTKINGSEAAERTSLEDGTEIHFGAVRATIRQVRARAVTMTV